MGDLLSAQGGGGGTQYTFVFQPGGAPAGNVYDDFALLMADLDDVTGPAILEVDYTFLSTAIPTTGGPWDLTDVVLTARNNGGEGYATVFLEPDVEFTGLRHVRNIQLAYTSLPATAAVRDMINGSVFVMEHAAIGGSGVFFSLENLDTVKGCTIAMRNESILLNEALEFNTPSFTNNYLNIHIETIGAVSSISTDTISDGTGIDEAIVYIRMNANNLFSSEQTLFTGVVNLIPTIAAVPLGLIDATGGQSILLPLAATAPAIHYIYANSTSSTDGITINTSGGDTIDGNANTLIADPFGFVWLVSDGISAWKSVSRSALQSARGIVSGASGATLNGIGFTAVRNSAGYYTVTFDFPMSVTPVIVVSVAENSNKLARFDGYSSTGFDVRTWDITGLIATDCDFSFMAQAVE